MFQLYDRAREDRDAAFALIDQLQRRNVREMFDRVRSALLAHKVDMTQKEIMEWDCTKVAHDYATYCASAMPIALRIMTESGAIKELMDTNGRKTYRMKRSHKKRNRTPAKSRKTRPRNSGQ